MKTYYYRPVGRFGDKKLSKLKQPITLCWFCAQEVRSATVLTQRYAPKEKCDRCGKEKKT